MGASVGPKQSPRLDLAAATLLDLLGSGGAAGAVSCLREVSSQAWDAILQLALRHGVAALLQRSLHAAGLLPALPAHVSARLEQQRRATALDNLRNYGEFRRVARVLREQAIPVIALKGLHLAELVYRDISLRPMIDLDLLVPLERREQAIAALRTLGYGFEESKLEQGLNKDWREASAALLDGKYHVGLVQRERATVVEIHWALADPLHPYRAPIEEIWRDAVPQRLGDVAASVMPPEFLLLHVCAHLAYNHVFAFGLRALCDIAEIVGAFPALDWAFVAEQGRRHGWRTGVAAALRLARDHAGARIPEQALAAVGANALDPERLAEALAHLLALDELPEQMRVAPNFMAAAGQSGLSAKLALAWRRLFVPRAELALIYGVPQHSARIGLYYALRLRDLVRTYASSAWALGIADPQLAQTAARQARLAKWISAD